MSMTKQKVVQFPKRKRQPGQKLELGGAVVDQRHGGAYVVWTGCDLRASLEEEKLPLVPGKGLGIMTNRAGTLIHIIHINGMLVRLSSKGGEKFGHGPYIYDRVVERLDEFAAALPPEVKRKLR